MELIKNQIFHIYNRGNNRQPIFFTHENYLFFLKKMRVHLLPTCDFLAYCLMPNHFHFLVMVKAETTGGTTASYTSSRSEFSNGLRIMLSSYTRAIQRQENLTGSLFQQNTKHKQVSSEWSWEDYTLICFRYILQNPVRAGLVKHPSEWPYSNCRELFGLRNGTLCNQAKINLELATHLNKLEDLVGVEVPTEVVAKIM